MTVNSVSGVSSTYTPSVVTTSSTTPSSCTTAVSSATPSSCTTAISCTTPSSCTTAVSSTTPSSCTTPTSGTGVSISTSGTEVNHSSATAKVASSATITYGGASSTAKVSSTTINACTTSYPSSVHIGAEVMTRVEEMLEELSFDDAQNKVYIEALKKFKSAIGNGDCEYIRNQSIINFMEGIFEDCVNFNIFNESEEKAIDSNYFSAYKGVLVFRIEGDRSGSFGAIFLTRDTEKREDATDYVRHEYGHTKQLEQLGIVKYALCIALPSWKEWGSNDDYYSREWEVTADIYGEVESREHSEEDIEAGFTYLENSKYFGPLVWLGIE